MGIWRNIGKIVILLFQIVHEQVKWTIRSFKRDTTKKSNTPSSELNNIHHSTSEILSGIGTSEIHSRVGSNYEPLTEEEESRQRSILMVELCEQPYYKND